MSPPRPTRGPSICWPGKALCAATSEGESLLFRPDAPVLRWQFLRMVMDVTAVRWFMYNNQSPFTDTFVNGVEVDTLRRVAEAGLELGITKGTSPTRLSPYQPISRAEAVTMLIRAAEAQSPGSTTAPASFAGSLGKFDQTHSENMRRAEYHHLLDGLEGFGPSWDPWQRMGRGEAAQVLANLSRWTQPMRAPRESAAPSLRGTSARREAQLGALSIIGVVCLAVEFVYQTVDTVALSSYLDGHGDFAVIVTTFLVLRILSGPVLFGVLTACGVIAVRRTLQGRPRRNLFAAIFAVLLAMLILLGPPWLRATSGASYAWGYAVCTCSATSSWFWRRRSTWGLRF